MPSRQRQTKITFTLGPVTAKPEVLDQVLLAGGDVCRLNMAHADHDTVRKNVAMLRESSKRTGREIPVMMDIKGPEIRTAARAEALHLVSGQTLDIVVDENGKADGDIPVAVVLYKLLLRDVPVGGVVLVDNGLIQLRVVEKRADRLRTIVEQPGKLGPTRRHVNLPGVKVELPALTEKDLADIAVAAETGCDYIALSFCREPGDIEVLREVLRKHGSKAKIIAKIEDHSAIENLEGIVKATDALMVARGDLGIEVPYYELPLIQKRAVALCIREQKPVIVATHMLESMIENPVPTRAEVSDVANAVLEQTDSIMLSGETTTGKHPLKCIEVMSKIAEKIEGLRGSGLHSDINVFEPRQMMMRSAASLAQDMGNVGIVAFTRGGNLPRFLAGLRPSGVPLYVFTEDLMLSRQMRLIWGVHPFLISFVKDPEANIANAVAILREAGRVRPGDQLVLATNVLLGEKIIDSVQIRSVS